MKYSKDRIIILSRVDYGERDRVLTVLGKNNGKFAIMAKGTRTAKSKLAGSIELLSESDVQYVEGRGRVYTLTGARLYKNYSKITNDIDRTMQTYDFLKILNRIIEEGHGSEYYDMLSKSLYTLDDKRFELDLVKAWFFLQVLQISGHLPSLDKDAKRNKLPESSGYNYDFEAHCFVPQDKGKYSVKDIKLLRLLTKSSGVPSLEGADSAKQIAQLVEQLARIHFEH